MTDWPTRARNALITTARRLVGGPGLDSTLDRAMQRLSRRVHIETIIDVGASSGIWTLQAQRHLKAHRALLIEAQGAAHEQALRALHASQPWVDYVIAAAGDHIGEIHFNADDPFSGSAGYESFGAADTVVPMTTVDEEVRRRGLTGPFLIKLDTHGFEAQILAGARETLAASSAVIIEAYNFELRPGVMRFPELCSHLEALGFRSIDLIDPMRRPTDGALWQMDLVFVPADRPEFRQATFT